VTSTPPGTDGTVGVAFPEVDGTRSTSATGRAVLAAAAGMVDPSLATRIRDEDRWRQRYATHLRDLVVAELRPADPTATPAAGADADALPRAGLDAAYAHFEYVGPDGARRLDAVTREHAGDLGTVAVTGTAPPAELRVPYRGALLAGDGLRRQVDDWVARSVVEPSLATAVHTLLDHPEWLELSDRTFVLLGAGAEMGPFGPLCAWGATVAAIDLPRPAMWQRLLATARSGAGTVLVPVRERPGDPTDDAALARAAGVDLLVDLPEAAGWVAALTGPLTIGGYAYADGAAHVRVNLAIDALVRHVLAERGEDVSLAALLTPTDVYAVTEEIVIASREQLARSGVLRRLARTATRSRAFAPNYPDLVATAVGGRYGIADALVLQQGPNYALAKRLQRWRLRVARADGLRVSANVAPATQTRSVTSNRVLAAAYAGAPRFGVEVFEPDTANTLMAALLVRDLRDPGASGAPTSQLRHPSELFVESAVHSGLWRNAFQPRSVLPLAAVLGLARVRR
jgi:hypothetical protein